MNSFIIIADDFTGSCDAGVNMAKNSIEVHVLSDPSKMVSGKSYVIDTESRNIPAEESRKIAQEAAHAASKLGFKYYYKKIDSTLRGHIRTETKAIADELGTELIVFNAACPDSGRTVINGNLYVNGTILTETEIVRDPFFLCSECNQPRVVAPIVDGSVQEFSLDTIREGRMQWDGSKAITFDTEKNEDIIAVLTYVLSLHKKTLFVGSAGMANGLFGIANSHKPAFAIVGSISDTSRNQLLYAEERGVHVVKMNMSRLLRNDDYMPYVEETVKSLRKGLDTILCSAYTYQDYLDTVEAAESLGLTKEEASRMTQKILGEAGNKIVDMVEIAGIFLTGGDTAISFIGCAGSDSCEILTEPLPVVPLIRMDSGRHSGLGAIVKGGSIGGPEALYYSFEYLKHNYNGKEKDNG